jgi:hypothetical protein
MGKQINFFLAENDISTLETYLQENNWVILSVPMPSENLIATANLRFPNPVLPSYPKLYLAQKNTLSEIKLKYIETQDYYLPDDIRSPLIEFFDSNMQDAVYQRGRLFYEGEYWTESGKIQKNEAFLKAADNLFRWFKKHFKKAAEAPFYGAYISQNILRYVQEGGKIAVN